MWKTPEKKGKFLAIRTEICYHIFEAEQLVADDGYLYDKVVITVWSRA